MSYRMPRTTTLAVVLALPALARAQASPAPHDTAHDTRWRPFVGCWQPLDASRAPRASAPVTCLVPDGADGVRRLVVTSERVTEEGRVAPLSATAAAPDSACLEISERRWSADGRRLLGTTSTRCGAATRRTSGVLTHVGDDLLDVELLHDGARSVIAASRWRRIGGELQLPDGRVVERGATLDTAAARDGVDAAAIVEAVATLDPGVLDAWLAERGASIPLGARALLALTDAKVPGRTIDLLVALGHPERWSIGVLGGMDTERSARARASLVYARRAFGEPDTGWPPAAYSMSSALGWNGGGRDVLTPRDLQRFGIAGFSRETLAELDRYGWWTPFSALPITVLPVAEAVAGVMPERAPGLRMVNDVGAVSGAVGRDGVNAAIGATYGDGGMGGGGGGGGSSGGSAAGAGQGSLGGVSMTPGGASGGGGGGGGRTAVERP